MISVGNISNSGVLAGVSDSTFALNNNKEDVVVLIALRDAETAATVTGVTYGGEALTQDVTKLQEDDDSSSDLRTYIFRKQGALTGSNNVVVTFSATVDHAAVFAVAVADLNDTGQPDTTVTAGQNFSSPYTTPTTIATQITTVAADTIIFDVVYSKEGTDSTISSGRTQIGQLGVNGNGDRAMAGYVIKSAVGPHTIGWSNGSEQGVDDWSQSIVAYKQTASADTYSGRGVGRGIGRGILR